MFARQAIKKSPALITPHVLTPVTSIFTRNFEATSLKMGNDKPEIITAYPVRDMALVGNGKKAADYHVGIDQYQSSGAKVARKRC